MGEYFGRVLYMNEGNRLKVISLTVLGSLSQLIVTIFFGLLALLVLKPDIINAGLSGWAQWINLAVISALIALLVLTVFLFQNRMAYKMDRENTGNKKIHLAYK